MNRYRHFNYFCGMEYIKNQIINYYRTANCDRYGQLKTISIGSVIDYSNQEELNYLQNLVSVCTYFTQYGTYLGFSAWGSFKCAELEKQCEIAFKQNKNRISNLNNW